MTHLTTYVGLGTGVKVYQRCTKVTTATYIFRAWYSLKGQMARGILSHCALIYIWLLSDHIFPDKQENEVRTICWQQGTYFCLSLQISINLYSVWTCSCPWQHTIHYYKLSSVCVYDLCSYCWRIVKYDQSEGCIQHGLINQRATFSTVWPIRGLHLARFEQSEGYI